jgi:peptide/nickel transport system permease protein
MLRFTLRRLLRFIPMLLVLILVVFGIMELSPGDPARNILGERASTEQLNLMREQLGIDRPFLTRYVHYVYNVFFKLDLGTSYRLRTPVLPDILAKFPYTLALALGAVLFSSLIGISLGLLSALRPYSPADTLATLGALVFASVPGFALGMVLILAFALALGLLPSGGASSWRHFILPLTALTLPAAAGTLRLTRSMMLEVLGRDYIRTARAKGLPERQVVLRHALKNGLIPVITSLGMHFGYLLGGAVITETVFTIPGLGSHLVNAVRMKDIPVVLGATVFLSVFFSLILLLLDLGCAFLDPRIRRRYGSREGRR